MPRRVFFSFDFDQDVFRANQVRNAPLLLGAQKTGFWDAAEREQVKRGGDAAIQRWIDEQLKGTSVTVVLIGQYTANSRWVKYEIQQSVSEGKGLLGVAIHNLKGIDGQASLPGSNPLSSPPMDWVYNQGYANMGAWVEAAARAAGR